MVWVWRFGSDNGMNFLGLFLLSFFFWVLNFLTFLGFYFYFNFFLFFHLVKIYTKHQPQKSNPDFRNMGLNLIFWVLNLLGLCFVDLVLAGF